MCAPLIFVLSQLLLVCGKPLIFYLTGFFSLSFIHCVFFVNIGLCGLVFSMVDFKVESLGFDHWSGHGVCT